MEPWATVISNRSETSIGRYILRGKNWGPKCFVSRSRGQNEEIRNCNELSSDQSDRWSLSGVSRNWLSSRQIASAGQMVLKGCNHRSDSNSITLNFRREGAGIWYDPGSQRGQLVKSKKGFLYSRKHICLIQEQAQSRERRERWIVLSRWSWCSKYQQTQNGFLKHRNLRRSQEGGDEHTGFSDHMGNHRPGFKFHWNTKTVWTGFRRPSALCPSTWKGTGHYTLCQEVDLLHDKLMSNQCQLSSIWYTVKN